MRIRHAIIWQCSILLFVTLTSAAQAAANNALESRLSLADARHLISRTGLGATIEELQHLTGKSRSEAIDYIMDGFTQSPALPMPAWTRHAAPLYWTRQDLQSDDKRTFDRRRDAELTELRQWWVDNLLTTTSPQTERMVLFWHNHFATSYDGVNRQSIAMAMQNATFRQHAVGNFRVLLKAMLRDPALLNFLDNLSNRKGAPNENLARELLELFTLGEGNFSEHTVREAARALTGYGISQNKNLSFELQSWKVDNTDKTLFGQSGDFNGDNLIDLILQQPASAYHIADRFWQAFVSDRPATREQLTPLVSAFVASDFDIHVLYRTLLEQNAFWSAESRASIIKSPVQLLVGTARSLDYPKLFNQQIPSLLARGGMNLFAPPNVAGWNGGNNWITSGRLLNRYAAIEKIALSEPHKTHQQHPSMNGNSMANMMATASDSAQLELHVAAEEYRGSADYRVELLSQKNELLWDSGKRALAGGHETTKYGRVNDVADLPWQVVRFPITQNTLKKAQSMRVHFLNDDGGQDGDRNLFVRGATIGTTWHDAAAGTQTSKCPPRSALNAGRLYCQGHVSLPITKNPAAIPESSKQFFAASAHINWVRAEADQLDLTLTLQDFYAYNKHYPTYSFHLHSTNGNAPRLEINNFGCWPDCVAIWPECAWTNDINPARKTLAFPLDSTSSNDTMQCHNQSLKSAERLIIHSLFLNAEKLLTEARESPREFNQEQSKALERWAETLRNLQPSIQQQFTDGLNVSVDSQVRRTEPPLQPAVQFTPHVTSANEAEEKLALANLSFTQLLLPGISPQQFPELTGIESRPAIEQLRLIFEHPVFQLQ